MNAQKTDTRPSASETGEAMNRLFARMQRWGARAGLLTMVVAFALYVADVLPGYVDVVHLPGLIGHPASVFTAQNGVPTGWAWLAHLEHGDVFSLFGLMMLVATVPAAFVAMLPLLLRRRDWIYAVLVAVQLGVFALAASGLLVR